MDKKGLNQVGYDLVSIQKPHLTPMPRLKEGIFFNHSNAVDIFHNAAKDNGSKEIIKQFTQKIEKGEYSLKSHLCPICTTAPSHTVAQGQLGFRWAVCQECGLFQCVDRLVDRDVQHYYTSGEYHHISMNNLDDEKCHLLEYKITSLIFIDIFKQLNLDLTQLKILEIGCGSGGIVRALKEKGATVAGFDIDEYRVKQGQKWVPELSVADAMAPDFPFPKDFDFILISNVLEHLSEPVQFMQRLHQKCMQSSEKGSPLIMIDVPNLESVHTYTQNQFSEFLDIAHIWYFTPITLERLLNQAGFRVEFVFSKDSSMTVIGQALAHPIDNTNNGFLNSVSAINFANYETDPNNLKSKIKEELQEIFQ